MTSAIGVPLGPPPKEYAEQFTLIQQGLALQQAQPGSKFIFNRPDELTWIGKLQPTPLNDRYTLKITLKKRGNPRIWILSPELKRRGDELIPHMYEQKRLCVFNPKKFQWNHRMKMSETILGWVAMWLYFYEIWLASGQWLGGGDHPFPIE